MQASHRVQGTFVALFLIGIFLPGLAMVTGTGTGADTDEKRALAAFPDLATTPLLELPRKIDDYVRDHFGFREALIRWNNRFKVRVLHTSPVRNAIVGRGGWLFYAGYGDGVDIRDHLGELPAAPAAVEARRNWIQERAAFFAERGITYLFVVVPNKQTIYPERTGLRRTPQPVTRLDQFAALMRQDPSLPFLDLRETLWDAREQRDLYFRTDSHWNCYGGFLGFQAILRKLATMRSDIPVVADDWAHCVDLPAPGGDVATLLSLSDELADVRQDIEWKDETQLPLRVALAGDSFAEGLQPFFETRFAYATPHDAAMASNFDLESILAQRPDIVIEEHAERYLTSGSAPQGPDRERLRQPRASR